MPLHALKFLVDVTRGAFLELDRDGPIHLREFHAREGHALNQARAKEERFVLRSTEVVPRGLA